MMRHIDSFCHFFPAKLFDLMSQTAGGTRDVGKRMQGVRTVWDLDARFRMMDEFKDYSAGALARPAADRGHGGNRARAGIRTRRQRWPCRTVCQVSRPVRRLGRRPADERSGRGGEGSRAHPAARQCQRPAASHQRQRPLPRRAAVLPDLRGRRQVRQADAAAPGAHGGFPRLRGRDQIEVRDLGRFSAGPTRPAPRWRGWCSRASPRGCRT